MVAIMCLSFVACSNCNNSDNERAKKEIIGTWEATESGGMLSGISLTFNEDGTGTYDDHSITWKYDSEVSCYILCVADTGSVMCIPNNFETDESGNQYFTMWGTKE
ncbi:MAG: hypothetical protein IKD02_01400 [Clostridia bacterium]|nr:hypothetical protein [Clostridia bacterium]